jgi:hypothetical protein
MRWRFWRKRSYLTAEDDPVLARIWDNDADAIFDEMNEAEAIFRETEEERDEKARPAPRPL